VVADDVVALSFDEAEGATVHPGFPQLKLWPEAAAYWKHPRQPASTWTFNEKNVCGSHGRGFFKPAAALAMRLRLAEALARKLKIWKRTPPFWS